MRAGSFRISSVNGMGGLLRFFAASAGTIATESAVSAATPVNAKMVRKICPPQRATIAVGAISR